jgi:hypothetical protein
MKLIYDTTECSRCGGSGEFSYNPMDGTRCFGCSGSGKQLSKKGTKAHDMWTELISKAPEENEANRLYRNEVVRKVLAYQATLGPDGGTAEGYEAREAKREARREATAKRREARFKKKAEELVTKRAEFLDQNPVVKEIWEAYKANDPRVDWGPNKEMSFLESVISRLESYSSLSEKQVAVLIKAWGRANDRAREDAEPKGPAPTGRVEVTGEVIGVKNQVSQFGDQLKMIVKLENGSKVWVSVPASLLGQDIRGKTIELTATFEVSKDDPHFAFGKRPKAKLKEA